MPDNQHCYSDRALERIAAIRSPKLRFEGEKAKLQPSGSQTGRGFPEETPLTKSSAMVPLQTTLDRRSGGPLNFG